MPPPPPPAPRLSLYPRADHVYPYSVLLPPESPGNAGVPQNDHGQITPRRRLRGYPARKTNPRRHGAAVSSENLGEWPIIYVSRYNPQQAGWHRNPLGAPPQIGRHPRPKTKTPSTSKATAGVNEVSSRRLCVLSRNTQNSPPVLTISLAGGCLRAV